MRNVKAKDLSGDHGDSVKVDVSSNANHDGRGASVPFRFLPLRYKGIVLACRVNENLPALPIHPCGLISRRRKRSVNQSGLVPWTEGAAL